MIKERAISWKQLQEVNAEVDREMSKLAVKCKKHHNKIMKLLEELEETLSTNK